MSDQTKELKTYVLQTRDKGMHIRVLNYGATLCEVGYLGHNAFYNLISSFEKPEMFTDNQINDSYYGASLGRYARCISKGQLHIDGTTYQLDQNFNEHHFHGGSEGFHTRIWSAEVIKEEEKSAVHLFLNSPDGDQGYPGKAEIEVIYTLFEDKRLSIEYKAKCSEPSLISLTNHSFWNLGSKNNIDHLCIKLNSDLLIELDSELLPTGMVKSLKDTDLDLSRLTALKALNIDDCFVLKNNSWAARLINPENKLELLITTNQPILAVYTAHHSQQFRQGICLQPTTWPDSPNVKNFPSDILLPNEEYYYCTNLVPGTYE